jgi:serine/threonine protein phosphatase PrpC
MEVRFWAATDTGRKRGHNEDNFLVDRDAALFVVCDGMGGHAAGEVASALVAKTVRDEVVRGSSDREIRDGQGRAANRTAVFEMLEEAVRRANGKIWQMAQADETRQGMGTTCVLMMVLGQTGFIANVGDSRLYRLRNGEGEQLTEDHSLRNHMIREGKLEEGEPMNRKNAVTRAVGVGETLEVDTFAVDLRAGDRFILCSDGLTEYLKSPAQLADLAVDTGLEGVTGDLIDHANHSGGKDNVTVMAIEVGEGQGIWDARRSTAKGRALRGLPHLANLSSEEFDVAIEQFNLHEVDAGTTLVKPTSPPDGLFFIVDGEVKLTERSGSSERIASGDFFGERALVGAASQGLKAVTTEPTRMAHLSRQRFEAILGANIELAAKITWNFLSGVMERLGDLGELDYRHPGRETDDTRKTTKLEAFEREQADKSTEGPGEPGGSPPPIPGGGEGEAAGRPPSGAGRAGHSGSGATQSGEATVGTSDRSSEQRTGDSGVVSGSATVSTAKSTEEEIAEEDTEEAEELSPREQAKANRQTVQMDFDDETPSRD